MSSAISTRANEQLITRGVRIEDQIKAKIDIFIDTYATLPRKC